MKDLLLHPITRQQIDTVVRSTPHAIIITGAPGSGKKTTALHTIAKILNRADPINCPYFLQILPDGQTIGIEAIRQIKMFLGKKTTGVNTIRRVVLLGDAHTMTTEAQNALLKVLEEPPADTMLILTTNDMTALKATIVSRAQQMNILPITKDRALEELKHEGYAEKDIILSYHMSGGQAGLLIALLNQNRDHEIVIAINSAKDFLRMKVYERLVQIDSLSKQKEQISLLLDGLQRVVASGLMQAAARNNHAQVKKFHVLSNQLQEAATALSKSANTKLILSNLFLHM